MDNSENTTLEQALLVMRKVAVVQTSVKERLEILHKQILLLTKEISLYHALGTPEDLGVSVIFLSKILQELMEKGDEEILLWLNETLVEARSDARLQIPELYPPSPEELPEGCPGWGTYSQNVLSCALCQFNIECMTLQERNNGGSAGFAQTDIMWLKNLEKKFDKP